MKRWWFIILLAAIVVVPLGKVAADRIGVLVHGVYHLDIGDIFPTDSSSTGTLCKNGSGVIVNCTNLQDAIPGYLTTKTTATNYTIGTTSIYEYYNGIVYVTGASTQTLPAVAVGRSVAIPTVGNIAVSVKPASGEQIHLAGTASDLTADHKITNTSTDGDIAVCSYYAAGKWWCKAPGWTDGGT